MQRNTLMGLVVLLLMILMSACGLWRKSTPEPTPVAETPSPTATSTNPAPTETPTPAPTQQPTLTPAPTAASTAAPTDEPCTLDAAYQADVTIPDDTQIAAGEAFTKTWRIRNSGTCAWDTDYQLAFVDGERMGGDDAEEVPVTAPGEDVDVSVRLVAPTGPGTYRGNWRICGTEAGCFGSQVYVQIVVPGEETDQTPLPPALVTLEKDGLRLAVQEIAWDEKLGIWEAGPGEVYLSLYIVATNDSGEVATFNPLDFATIDGNGEVNGTSILAERAPKFNLCLAAPADVCQGWWTTQMVDQPETRAGVVFRWKPDWFDAPVEVSLPTE